MFKSVSELSTARGMPCAFGELGALTHQNSPLRRVKTQSSTPAPQLFDSVGVEWSPRTCISRNFPDVATCPRTPLSESLL